MDEPGKEDIYIKKKTNNNYCTIFFYLYNIKYISFYVFYVLHFTFQWLLKYVEGGICYNAATNETKSYHRMVRDLLL